MLTKNNLRTFTKNAIKQQTANNIFLDAQIVGVVKKHVSQLEQRSFGIYYPNEYEIDLLSLIQEFPHLLFALPKLVNNQLIFTPYSPNIPLQLNQFNIYEPVSNEKIIPQVLLIPGLAFSIAGYRLGYGKGYYDQYLATNKQMAIGICRRYQLLSTIPIAAHDQKMNSIITELGKFDIIY